MLKCIMIHNNGIKSNTQKEMNVSNVRIKHTKKLRNEFLILLMNYNEISSNMCLCVESLVN